MRVVADTLEGANPFMLLADGVPGARADMGKENLVVVGAEFAAGQAGFVILNSQVDPSTGDAAGGEKLQDHDCVIGN